MGEGAVPFLPQYVICVDKYTGYAMKGRLYCGEDAHDGFVFNDINRMLLHLENRMDTIQCPGAGKDLREFVQKKEVVTLDKVKKREAIKAMRRFNGENEHGQKATFVLEVRFRQNSSWQGTVRWVEKKQVLNFRSALELIKIIDSACEQGYQVDVNGLDENNFTERSDSKC